MIITIKSLPLSKNKYVNMCWQARGRYKKDIHKEIYYEMIKQDLRNSTKEPLKKAKIAFRLYFKTNRRRDSANYLGGGIISILDSLVDIGVIIDDNHEVIGNPKVELYIDKNDPRCEIEVVG